MVFWIKMIYSSERRNLLPSSSEVKSKPSKKPAEAVSKL
jgi:hypothetical protein